MEGREQLIRVPYVIFSSREAAREAGWPDAEFGVWQTSPGGTACVEGWIALQTDTADE